MRYYFLALSAAAISLAASAAPLSPDEALSRALQSGPRNLAGKSVKYELVRTQKNAERDAVYVFGNAGHNGFIVTSADDCSPALLGYGDSRLCDENGHMAPAFEAWIQQLARQVDFAASNESDKKVRRLAREEKDPIAPLCKTLWSQDAPFNDLCPMLGNKRTVTGCVATSISQVMKYHNWPAQGEGDVSYTWNGQKLSENFAEVTFDWASMLDSYDDTSSENSRLAVATLMKSVGYALNMNYDVEASDAQAINVGQVLGKYFKYDKSLRYLLRDYYTLYDWEDIIYNSLKQYGPVVYDAQAGLGGHSFVCDGYDANGYFHFNWGWAGLSDGYFLLDALNPSSQGIGGANGGFNFMQDVIVGIRPDKTGDSQWSHIMYGERNCQFQYDASMKVISLKSSFYNYGPGTIQNAWAGLRFQNIDDPTAEPILELSNYRAIKVAAGVGGFGIPVPDLPNGRYSIEAVYRSGNSDDDPLIPVIWPLYGQGSCIFTADNGNYSLQTFGTQAPDFNDPWFPEELYKKGPVAIMGTLVNPNDAPYLCYLSEMLYDKDMLDLITFSAPIPVELEPLESLPVNIDVNIMGLATLPDGLYNLVVSQLIMQNSYIVDLTAPHPVMLTSISGIDNLFDAPLEGKVEYFTVNGVKVAESVAGDSHPDLTPGLYVVKSSAGSKLMIIR